MKSITFINKKEKIRRVNNILDVFDGEKHVNWAGEVITDTRVLHKKLIQFLHKRIHIRNNGDILISPYVSFDECIANRKQY